MNDKTNNVLDKLSSFFSKYNLLLGPHSGNFYFDEPRHYNYFAEVNSNSTYFKNDDYFLSQRIYGGGASFFNQETALIKCLAEAAERICQETFIKKDILYQAFSDITGAAIDPAIHTSQNSVRNEKLGWVKGYNITNGDECHIPAQYAHYTYSSYRQETDITTLISTGGALGFTHESSLLSGLYELIERDAFMTTYLIKASVTRIEIEKINNNQIQYINSYLKKYLLNWYLFDISNDLQIPVFLSIITDNSGIGPAVTAGACSRFDIYEGIINSVTEAIMSRPLIRASLADNKSFFAVINKDKKRIRRRLERALYWYSVPKIKELNFWINKSPSVLNHKINKFNSKADELSFIISMIKEKYPYIYYSDLTHKELKTIGFYVYKVINPYLHGLYLDESESRATIDPNRLKSVANHFGIKKYHINPIPHPFL